MIHRKRILLSQVIWKVYVKQDLRRKEMLAEIEYSQYLWSFRTLDRRLRHFNIYYIDKDVKAAQVKCAVGEEIDGSGKLLGYNAEKAPQRALSQCSS